MTLTIYSYEKCSTCKKALSALKEWNVPFLLKDIKNSPPSIDELKKIMNFMDGNLRKLMNTSGILYREWGLAKKIDTLSVDEVLQLLSQHGMLIKRPLLLTKLGGIAGFHEKKWKMLIEAMKLVLPNS
jgi:arsenate reductase